MSTTTDTPSFDLQGTTIQQGQNLSLLPAAGARTITVRRTDADYKRTEEVHDNVTAADIKRLDLKAMGVGGHVRNTLDEVLASGWDFAVTLSYEEGDKWVGASIKFGAPPEAMLAAINLNLDNADRSEYGSWQQTVGSYVGGYACWSWDHDRQRVAYSEHAAALYRVVLSGTGRTEEGEQPRRTLALSEQTKRYGQADTEVRLGPLRSVITSNAPATIVTRWQDVLVARAEADADAAAAAAALTAYDRDARFALRATLLDIIRSSESDREASLAAAAECFRTGDDDRANLHRRMSRVLVWVRSIAQTALDAEGTVVGAGIVTLEDAVARTLSDARFWSKGTLRDAAEPYSVLNFMRSALDDDGTDKRLAADAVESLLSSVLTVEQTTVAALTTLG